LDAYQQARASHGKTWAPLIALALCLASIYAFSIGYVFRPAIGCFQFPHERPWEYPWFMGLMFARFIGVSYAQSAALAAILGGVLLVLMVAVLVRHTLILVKSATNGSHTSRAIAILIGYSLVFCANTAIGRICGGLEDSQSSRYATLLIPAFF